MALSCVNNLIMGEYLWCDAIIAWISILWGLWMTRHFAASPLRCRWRASSLILTSITPAMPAFNTAGTVVTSRTWSTLSWPISWIIGTSTSRCVPTPLNHSYFIVAFTSKCLSHYRHFSVYLVICWQKLLLVVGIRTLILVIWAERYVSACWTLLTVFTIFNSPKSWTLLTSSRVAISRWFIFHARFLQIPLSLVWKAAIHEFLMLRDKVPLATIDTIICALGLIQSMQILPRCDFWVCSSQPIHTRLLSVTRKYWPLWGYLMGSYWWIMGYCWWVSRDFATLFASTTCRPKWGRCTSLTWIGTYALLSVFLLLFVSLFQKGVTFSLCWPCTFIWNYWNIIWWLAFLALACAAIYFLGNTAKSWRLIFLKTEAFLSVFSLNVNSCHWLWYVIGDWALNFDRCW